MGKNWRLVVAALAITIAVFAAESNGVNCTAAYRNDKAVGLGSTVIGVEVVRTKQEKANGLSGRDCIGDGQGMLFIYEKPGRYSFWMKDMKFPIDIIWIGPDKKVVWIEKMVKPSTYPDSFVNKDKPAKYVLELKAGQTDQLDIGLGTPVNF